VKAKTSESTYSTTGFTPSTHVFKPKAVLSREASVALLAAVAAASTTFLSDPPPISLRRPRRMIGTDVGKQDKMMQCESYS
jgi:hypothetical protein